MIVDPLIAMAAAIEQLRAGGVAEVELDWVREEGSVEERLTMTVRREVRPFVAPPEELS